MCIWGYRSSLFSHQELAPSVKTCVSQYTGQVLSEWVGVVYLECQSLMSDAWHLLTPVSFRRRRKHLNCKITLQEIMSGYHILLGTALPDNKATAVNIPFSLDLHLHIMQMGPSEFPL